MLDGYAKFCNTIFTEAEQNKNGKYKKEENKMLNNLREEMIVRELIKDGYDPEIAELFGSGLLQDEKNFSFNCQTGN